MLLHRDRVVGSTLHRGVVGQHHAFQSTNTSDAGDQSTGGYIVVAIHLVTGKLTDFEESRARVQQSIDSLSRQHFVAAQVFRPGAFATTH